MSKWTVTDSENKPLIVIEVSEETISLHIPSPKPVDITREQAEEIRLKLGAAVGDARSDPPTPQDVQPWDEKTD